MRESARGAAGRVLPYLGGAVLLVQAGLVAGGVLSLRTAAVVAVAVEVCLAGVAVLLALTARGEYRRRRAAGEPTYEAVLGAFGAVLPAPVAWLLRHEAGTARALWLRLRGRRDVPPGAAAVSYGGQLRVMVVAFLVLTPVEVAVVELLLPWRWLRLTLLVLALYGAVFLAGVLAALWVRPHVVGPDRLVLRFLGVAEVSVPLSDVVDVAPAHRGGLSGTVAVSGTQVALPVNGFTSVAVTLRPGALARVAGRGEVPASRLCFDADDLAGAVAAVRAALPAPPG